MCYTCMQDEDNAEHILVQCVYAREVWHACFDTLQLNSQAPCREDTWEAWWLTARIGFQGKDRRGLDSLVIGVAWSLWKQRNARVFNRLEQCKGPRELARWIIEDVLDWSRAGVGVGGLHRFVRH